MANENTPLITRDILALERTHLANERTFLAYFRTFIVFLSSGVAILKLSALQEIHDIGWVLIAIAPFILLIGIWRLWRVNKKIQQYYTRPIIPSPPPPKSPENSPTPLPDSQ